MTEGTLVAIQRTHAWVHHRSGVRSHKPLIEGTDGGVHAQLGKHTSTASLFMSTESKAVQPA